MKVEVDLADLEALLELADSYVYWADWSLKIATRIEDVINKAKESNVD